MDAIERGFRFAGAVIVASLAAGPITWFGAVLISLPSGRGTLSSEVLAFALLTIPYGAIIAFLPNLVGTAIMTALGSWFPLARSPLAWIGAGGLGGALFAILNSGPTLTDGPFVAIMTLTGMACAAICRAFTRWPD